MVDPMPLRLQRAVLIMSAAAIPGSRSISASALWASCGRAAGMTPDKAKPEPEQTLLNLLDNPVIIRSLDGSRSGRSKAVFLSTECVSQTFGVPQSPDTFGDGDVLGSFTHRLVCVTPDAMPSRNANSSCSPSVGSAFVPRTAVQGRHNPPKANNGRSSPKANQCGTADFPAAYSQKANIRTRQRFAGPIQARQ